MTEHNLDLAILEYGYTKRDGRFRSGLEFTVALAQIAEECGYSRFWFTEHHGVGLQIACPEVVIAAVAAKTSRIRVGSAGILLNYYSPFKVAETFHTLATLFPGRIDLGLARGIGATPEVAALLWDALPRPVNANAAAALFERKVRDVIAHLRSGYEAQRKMPSDAALPSMPEIWLHGTGTVSAALAAKLGTKLTMAAWLPDTEEVDVPATLAAYAARFQMAPDAPAPAACLSLAGICAETDAEAEVMLSTVRERFGSEAALHFCGSPERCRDTIIALADRHGVREVLIHVQHVPRERQERMVRLLADVMLKGNAKPK